MGALKQLEMQNMMLRAKMEQQPAVQPMQPMVMPAPNPMFSNVQITLKKRGKKKNLAQPRMSAPPVGYAPPGMMSPAPGMMRYAPNHSPALMPGHQPNAMSVNS